MLEVCGVFNGPFVANFLKSVPVKNKIGQYLMNIIMDNIMVCTFLSHNFLVSY